jgi:predicted transcriptional regulator
MVYSPIDPEFCGLPCRVLMDRSVPTVEASERLTGIVSSLMENYHGDIIAVEDGQPIGCFNMFDAMRWLTEPDIHRSDIYVKDVVCTPVISVKTENTVEEALGVMRKYGIKSVAVSEAGLLKGYITENGIKEWVSLYPHYLRLYQATKQGKCSALMDEIFGSGSPTG